MRQWFRRSCRLLFPGHIEGIRVPLAAFLLFNAAVRLGLAIFNGDRTVFLPWRFVPVMVVGFAFDLTVGLAVAAPLAAFFTLWPRGETSTRWFVRFTAALLVPFSVLVTFVGAAEFTFWNEFDSRFNFIAVDYLVYTNEVIGNIRESYDLPLVFSGVALGASTLWWWTQKGMSSRLSQAEEGSAGRPWTTAVAWVLAAALSIGLMDQRMKNVSADSRMNELAGNGYWEFVHAFRFNEIDYSRFYRTLPETKALAQLEHEIDRGGTRYGATDHLHPCWREIEGAPREKRMNVVMISVESLSASFLGAFGNTEKLTPNLDRLAAEGLFFSRIYATGTRTVRGLEALTLSIPPTPGHSIVKRPGNDHLFSIGQVFREHGYESIYAYGGYGYFDNMSTFFGGNGYTVIDRTALSSDEITKENIWGVADEDLFRHAIRELDRRHEAGTSFFAHVMTTSNHRPFTYPSGRIDIPSGSNRRGAVKYTDWAIGHFFEEARARPWFANTLFVVVADHTHKGRGRIELPLDNYHIPLIIYSPGNIQPSRVDTIASQIDVAPTIFGLLGFHYRSRFFGHDILKEGAEHPRALMARISSNICRWASS